MLCAIYIHYLLYYMIIINDVFKPLRSDILVSFVHVWFYFQFKEKKCKNRSRPQINFHEQEFFANS